MRKSMTYGVLPTREEFDTAFEQVSPLTGRFRFSNDPRVGTVELTCSELWREIGKAHDEWYAAGVSDADRNTASEDAAGQWCSDVLGVLGFEWI